jgi:hypothetical protein
MQPKLHLIVCEGKSEWVYVRRLQRFLDSLPLPPNTFETPLRFVGPEHAAAKNGAFGKLLSSYNKARRDNKKARSIQVWADFDLYHRNDGKCAEHYAAKTEGIPDFLFSFHNFEDFFALHFDGEHLALWRHYGGTTGRRHFTKPLHARDYRPEIERIFPGYTKGGLPADFVSWNSLRNLKANLRHQPAASNPQNLRGFGSFAEFIIREVDRVYPGFLS